MYLFILESIGTQELILIAVVALIVFGPRKLPQMAKTIAKTMAEFRNATSEFKSTWEKEASLVEEDFKAESSDYSFAENKTLKASSETVTERQSTITQSPTMPEIKELSAEDFSKFNLQPAEEKVILPKQETSETKNGKRNWL